VLAELSELVEPLPIEELRVLVVAGAFLDKRGVHGARGVHEHESRVQQLLAAPAHQVARRVEVASNRREPAQSGLGLRLDDDARDAGQEVADLVLGRVDVGGSDHGDRAEHADDVRDEVGAARPLGVRECCVILLRGRRGATARPEVVALHHQRERQAPILAEPPKRVLGGGELLPSGLERPRAADRVQDRPDRRRVRLPPLATGGGQLVHVCVRVADASDVQQRQREVRHELETLDGSARQERRGSLQQASGRVLVGAPQRALARGGQPHRTSCRQAVVVAAELAPVEHRLLEVVADDLVLLDEVHVLLDPEREALVQIGARLLRQRIVGSVADQEVTEAERVVSRHRRGLGPDQLGADQLREVAVEPRANALGRELRDRQAVEDLTLDGPALDHRPLVGRQLVESCLEERVDRGRDDDVGVGASPVAEHEQHLLDEERVPLRRIEDARPGRVVEVGAAEQVVDQRRGLGAAERLEQQRRRVRLPAAPGGTELEQLGTRDAEQEDRRPA
jgi:hypothetical protein